jgi:predicted Zn-dependent protease
MNPLLRNRIGLGAAGVVLVSLVVWGGCEIAYRRTLGRIRSAMQKNLPAVAADLAECHRYRMAKSDDGCALMIAAYHDSRNMPRVEWAAEACAEAGRQGPEIFLGLATAAEAAGRPAEALMKLAEGIKMHPNFPEFHLRTANLMKQAKRYEEAAASFMKVAELLPQNVELSFEILQYMVSIQKWAEAKTLVDRLQGVKDAPPEAKVYMAMALEKFGDHGSSRNLVEEAKRAIGNDKQRMEKIRAAFPDLMK